MARRSGGSVFDQALDIFRVKQYFDVALELREWERGIRADAGFAGAVARAAVALPGLPPPRVDAADRRPLPPFRHRPVPALAGRRVAVVCSGGSGALASLIGVVRALEETDATLTCLSLCSGSTLFGFPLATGLSADRTAELVLGLTGRDLVDVDWSGLVNAPLRLGRGFTGILRGDRIEATVRRMLGDVTLGELALPAYAPVWDVEHNRLDYLGPRTHPDLPVARAVRLALSLPPVYRPPRFDGRHWCDGGIVDILPVHPVLDLEPPPQVAVVVNAFHPAGLAGEDATGWAGRPLAILELAAQVRTSQHIQLARENLARLRAEVPEVLLVEPVPYDTVRGTGFYRQFVDPTDWPRFVRAGYDATRAALRTYSAGAAQRA